MAIDRRAEDDPRVCFVPFAEAALPPVLPKVSERFIGLVHCVAHKYWAVHPKRGLVLERRFEQLWPRYWATRECAEDVAGHYYSWGYVERIPIAYWVGNFAWYYDRSPASPDK